LILSRKQHDSFYLIVIENVKCFKILLTIMKEKTLETFLKYLKKETLAEYSIKESLAVYISEQEFLELKKICEVFKIDIQEDF
jgi:hypothetical protein